MRRPHCQRTVAWALLGLALFPVSAKAATDLADLDALVAADMARFDVPGMAVGVISGGKVVAERAYGWRDRDRHLPVTIHTAFPVGSITKGFTAALAQMAEREGRISLDVPVRRYLPGFALADPKASAQVTLRDFLLHRSGLPSHDFLRVAVPQSRSALLAGMARLDPNIAWRSGFQYNNLGYVVAGEAVARAQHTQWEALVNRRLLAPLAMRDSTVTIDAALRRTDRALGYGPRSDGKAGWQALGPYSYQRYGVGPNGALNASLHDLLAYVRFQLSGRDARGNVLLDGEGLAALHVGQVPVNGSVYGRAYALGWFVDEQAGHKVVIHAGSIFGYHVIVALVPDLDAGLVVASNQPWAAPTRALGQALLDRLLGGARPDRIEAMALPKVPAIVDSVQAAPVSAELLGTYHHPAYGSVTVEAREGRIWLSFPDVAGPLVPQAPDDFRAAFLLDKAFPLAVPVRVVRESEGRVSALAMDLAIDGEAGVPPVLFEREPQGAR